MGTEKMEQDINQTILGAEGLLDLGFYDDAAELYLELSTRCPSDYRVWLGMARIRSKNFTEHSSEIQSYLDRAADCALTLDAYSDLQETAGWYATIKPYAGEKPKPHTLPDTESLMKIKPMRIPLASEEGVKQAREMSRMSYLKFLLLLVIIIGLPVGFIVSCSEGINPITNFISENFGEDSETDLESSTKTEATTAPEEPTTPGETTLPAGLEACPYPQPAEDVKSGMVGDAVLWSQWYLFRCGINVAETGTYDAETEQAVRDFQSAYGIRVDGIVGIETVAKLMEIYATQGIPS